MITRITYVILEPRTLSDFSDSCIWAKICATIPKEAVEHSVLFVTPLCTPLQCVYRLSHTHTHTVHSAYYSLFLQQLFLEQRVFKPMPEKHWHMWILPGFTMLLCPPPPSPSSLSSPPSCSHCFIKLRCPNPDHNTITDAEWWLGLSGTVRCGWTGLGKLLTQPENIYFYNKFSVSGAVVGPGHGWAWSGAEGWFSVEFQETTTLSFQYVITGCWTRHHGRNIDHRHGQSNKKQIISCQV